MILILLAYLALGAYMASKLPPNDFERSYLDLDRSLMLENYQREFGLATMPRRMPFRLPLEYWVYEWARSLPIARAGALGVSALGLWLTMQYASSIAGAQAGLLAGCVILSSPYIVGSLVSASYKAPVATLWVGGLYALSTEHWKAAMACGLVLGFLRATSWGMAGYLLLASGGIWGGILVISGLGAYLWLNHREVVLSQGWVRLLKGESCPVQGLPDDGWGYALRTLVRRYESWGAWGLAALLLGHWGNAGHVAFTNVLIPSLGVLAVTHFPRALIRPKWVIGYLPDYAFAAAVGIACWLT